MSKEDLIAAIESRLDTINETLEKIYHQGIRDIWNLSGEIRRNFSVTKLEFIDYLIIKIHTFE